MTRKSPESFSKKLKSLTIKFDKHKDFYLSKEYNESQVRIDFLDPLFEALGWDIANKRELPYHRREVIVERGDIPGRDRPDYAFRLNGRTKFFVEAKAPNQPLDNIYHVHQAKTYAWSSPDASIAILTDFEGIKIFDCRTLPDIKKPQKGLIKEIHYLDFEKNADFLWDFSKKSVEQGSLETLLKTNETSRDNRIAVDKDFLKFLMAWKVTLANQIKNRNKRLNVSEIEHCVELLLNRVVFLRVAEDREILTRPTLISMAAYWEETKGFSLWEKLREHFEKINEDLNGMMFHTSELFSRIDVDDELIHELVTSFYFPNAPYRFDQIPIELLGTIYEQYLGKEFAIKNGKVVLEDKSFVRKAGGVYYTPHHIVSHIVENTISKTFYGKKYSEISRLSILDPACGSGSFLITAFGKLMEYHLDYLLKNPKDVVQGRFFPDLVKDDQGEIKLSIEKKRNILQNHIFGVDIDQQAVNICIMSLYLKALEGEQRLPNRKSLLPSLEGNIKCGNSLVSGSTPELERLIGPDYTERRPFSWEHNFPKQIRNNGFDVIIMNPPYVKIQNLLDDEVNDVKFLQEKYKSTKEGSADIYVAFIEKALTLLHPKGQLGLICPHKFFQAKYGKETREILTKEGFLREIVYFNDIQIFHGASTYTCLIYCSKDSSSKVKFSDVKIEEKLVPSLQLSLQTDKPFTSDALIIDFIEQKKLREAEVWNLVVGPEQEIFEALSKKGQPLGEICPKIYQGVISGADTVFMLEGELSAGKRIQKLYSRELDKLVEVEAEILKPVLRGSSDIKPYLLEAPTHHIIFPYSAQADGSATLIPEKDLQERFPKAHAYLKLNKPVLEKREKGKWKGKDWHCFSRNQNLVRFQQPKIMVPYMLDRLTNFYDRTGGKYFVNVTTGGYGIELDPNAGVSYEYLSGILCSSLMDFFIRKVSSNFRGGYFPCSKQYLENLPILIPEAKEEKALAKKIEILMTTVQKKLDQGKEISDDEKVENQRELDSLTEELYKIKLTAAKPAKAVTG